MAPRPSSCPIRKGGPLGPGSRTASAVARTAFTRAVSAGPAARARRRAPAGSARPGSPSPASARQAVGVGDGRGLVVDPAQVAGEHVRGAARRRRRSRARRPRGRACAAASAVVVTASRCARRSRAATPGGIFVATAIRRRPGSRRARPREAALRHLVGDGVEEQGGVGDRPRDRSGGVHAVPAAARPRLERDAAALGLDAEERRRTRRGCGSTRRRRCRARRRTARRRPRRPTRRSTRPACARAPTGCGDAEGPAAR